MKHGCGTLDPPAASSGPAPGGKSRVIWCIDGHQVMSAVQEVPQEAMYFIANLAVKNQQNPAGWKDGSALDIRSVTVWQAASYH